MTFIHLNSDYSVLTLYKCKCSFVHPFQCFAFMDSVSLVAQETVVKFYVKK